MKTRWRWLAALGLAGLATAGAGAPVDADEAGGAPGASFAATAAAEGVRVGVAAPGYLLTDQLVDAGGPLAQATVNALGQSKALAAYPFPGDLVIAGPGTLAGFTGLPALPGYPFVVESESPVRPEATAEQGPHRLRAHSSDRASSAEAATAAGGGDAVVGRTSAVADVVADEASGTVRAVAGNDVEAVRVGDVLRLGRVASEAKAERDRAGQLSRSSALAVGEVLIAGQAFGFTEQGLVVAGTTVPVAADDSAARALAGAGISLRYLAPVETADGVVAAGIEITQLARPGVPGAPAEIKLTLTLGRAAAFASGTLARPAVPPVPGEPVEVGSQSGVGAPAGPAAEPDGSPGAGATNGDARATSGGGGQVTNGEAGGVDHGGAGTGPYGAGNGLYGDGGPGSESEFASTAPARGSGAEAAWGAIPGGAGGSGEPTQPSAGEVTSAAPAATTAPGGRSGLWQPIATVPQTSATGFYAIVAIAAVVALGGVAAIRGWAVKR
ncbi:MAG: hypothetical protein AB1679_11355 [Actinomycetota bacterium]|jgi:hypothetical protein